MVENSPEGGYTAWALGESIVTEADSLEELHAMVRDAVQCYFDDEVQAAKPFRLHFLNK